MILKLCLGQLPIGTFDDIWCLKVRRYHTLSLALFYVCFTGDSVGECLAKDASIKPQIIKPYHIYM